MGAETRLQERLEDLTERIEEYKTAYLENSSQFYRNGMGMAYMTCTIQRANIRYCLGEFDCPDKAFSTENWSMMYHIGKLDQTTFDFAETRGLLEDVDAQKMLIQA